MIMKVSKLIDGDLYRIINKTPSSKMERFAYLCKYFISDRGFRAIFLYRMCRFHYYNGNKVLYAFFRFFNFILNPIEISVTTEIGMGLYIMHPQCIVIGGGKLGNNIDIAQGVTIGLKDKENEYPSIGDNVHLGAGCMILGDINIGDNSRVGANAVVITDIPKNSIAVGVPAKIKKMGKSVYKPANISEYSTKY